MKSRRWFSVLCRSFWAESRRKGDRVLNSTYRTDVSAAFSTMFRCPTHTHRHIQTCPMPATHSAIQKPFSKFSVLKVENETRKLIKYLLFCTGWQLRQLNGWRKDIFFFWCSNRGDQAFRGGCGGLKAFCMCTGPPLVCDHYANKIQYLFTHIENTPHLH